LQDILVFALIGIALISGVVLMFDVRSINLRLPHPALPRLLLPTFGPLGLLLNRFRKPEYDYEEYDDEDGPLLDLPVEEAGSFAPSRSPFQVASAPRRRRRSEPEEDEDDFVFDGRRGYEAEDEDDAGFEAPVAEADDEAPDADGDDDEEAEEDGEEAASEDPDDLMSFFEKAPEASKVPEGLRNELEHVSAAELLAEARALSALLRGGRSHQS
jgi:hypothetical protein